MFQRNTFMPWEAWSTVYTTIYDLDAFSKNDVHSCYLPEKLNMFFCNTFQLYWYCSSRCSSSCVLTEDFLCFGQLSEGYPNIFVNQRWGTNALTRHRHQVICWLSCFSSLSFSWASPSPVIWFGDLTCGSGPRSSVHLKFSSRWR